MLMSKKNGHKAKMLNPKEDPSSIGNLAIRRGYATADQVSYAIQKQEERLPLGKILVEEGVLTSAQLEELLIEQEVLRNRMNEYEASKFIQEKRREKLAEVTKGFREVAISLQMAAKG